MFDTSIERTIIGTAIVLWLAHGWYLNDRLAKVHSKLDRLGEQFNGLREYLYEIDPQFDDEREARHALDQGMKSGGITFAGMEHAEMLRRKEADGRRTLASPFIYDDK